MKILQILLLSFLLPLAIIAQTTITWKGGTPGKENKWNEPKNWDSHRIPSEDDKVVIKMENNGHFSQAIIDSEVHINWLVLQSGAELRISESGKLLIDGTFQYSEGISMHGGSLISEGNIILKNIDDQYIAAMSPGFLKNKISLSSKQYGYEFYITPCLDTNSLLSTLE